MKGYVEFTGKTLDEAIKEACAYFGVPREKLEIEIVSDAKTGIFGLVGAKKATLRAKRVQLETGLSFGENTEAAADKSEKSGKNRRNAEVKNTPAQRKKAELQPRAESALALRKDNLPATPAQSEPAGPVDPAVPPAPGGQEQAGEDRGGKRAQSKRGQRSSARKEPSGKDAPTAQTAPATKEKPEGGRQAKKGDAARNSEDGRERKRGRNERNVNETSSRRNAPCAKNTESQTDNAEGLEFGEGAIPDFAEQLPVVPLEAIDQDLLRFTVLESLKQLIEPIVGEAETVFEIADGRVRLHVNCAENHGLLIGRDGQTLASLQYLLSCIASRKLNASVRIQIDAGDYREKQDEKLRELALSLARKVKENSRPQSTRPLSAYHRRIIHMTLQDDPEVQTHSKGEGGLKRVVVVPRRKAAQAG